jgi:hypothetical protein
MNSEWNAVIFFTKCFVFIQKKKAPKRVYFQISSHFSIYWIKYSIEILILRINSIASLLNSNVSPEVGCLFHFSYWFWICAFWPFIDQQTFNFFNLALDSANFRPYIYTPFIVWSLVLDFFDQIPNYPSNFNIYAIKLLIWPH